MINGLGTMTLILSSRRKLGQIISVLAELWRGVSTSTRALGGRKIAALIHYLCALS